MSQVQLLQAAPLSQTSCYRSANLETFMPTTFTGALKAALKFQTLRQRVVFSSLAAGSFIGAAGAAAHSYPIWFIGMLIAFGALVAAKP